MRPENFTVVPDEEYAQLVRDQQRLQEWRAANNQHQSSEGADEDDGNPVPE